jgi:hypothetical protein
MKNTLILASIAASLLSAPGVDAQDVGDPVVSVRLRCNGSSIRLTYPAGSEFSFTDCGPGDVDPNSYTGATSQAASNAVGCQPCQDNPIECIQTITPMLAPGVVAIITEVQELAPPFLPDCILVTFEWSGDVSIDVSCNCN